MFVLTYLAAVAFAPQNVAALQRMIDAERAFSRTCGEIGIRDSFLHFLAPDAVIFNPTAVNAHSVLEKQPPSADKPATTLSWYPVTGDISEAGDLGYSTGPYFITDNGTKKQTYAGSFFSIWKLQPDGEYKVVLDQGASIPPTDPSKAPKRFKAIQAKSRSEPAAKSNDLMEMERLFARRARAGYAQALKKWAAFPNRFYREGSEPLTYAALLPKLAGRVLSEWQPATAVIATSGDMGYTYGSYAFSAPAEKGSFIRVWRRDAKGFWRIAVDVLRSDRKSG